MTAERNRWLIATEWLAANLGVPDIAIVDGTWFLPPLGRDARAGYKAAHPARNGAPTTTRR